MHSKISNLFVYVLILGIVKLLTVEGNVIPNNKSPREHEKHTCVSDQPFVWCIPNGYNKEEEPWRHRHITSSSFPWDYHFKFNIFDVLKRIKKSKAFTKKKLIHFY